MSNPVINPPTMPNKTRPMPHAGRVAVALTAVYLVWGSTYFGIRIAIESIPPLLMAGSRFMLAGTLMVAFARWWLCAAWPTRRQWRDAFIVGGCLLTAGNGGATLAECYIPSGLTATLVTTVPMYLLLFGWLVGMSPRPGVLTCFALALGIVGVCFLVRPGAVGGGVGSDRSSPVAQLYTGSAIILGACVVWAAGSLYSRRADKPASASLGIGIQMLAGSALVLLLSWLRGEWTHFHPGNVSSRSLWAFLYLTSVGSLVGYSAYVWLLGAASPVLVGTYAFVNPGVAVLLGWAFGGETVDATMLLGMGIILVAVALIVVFPPRPVPTVLPPPCPRPVVS